MKERRGRNNQTNSRDRKQAVQMIHPIPEKILKRMWTLRADAENDYIYRRNNGVES